MDQIDVELDEDELEHMQRLINQGQKQEGESAEDDNAIDIKEQSIEDEYAVDTPLSNLSQEKLKQEQMKHNNKIQSELRQLLAQSSSEQLLMLNDDANNMNLTSSEEQELRRRWLHENGLFSKEQSADHSPSKVLNHSESDEEAKPSNSSIELGEQPVDTVGMNLRNESFAPDLFQNDKPKSVSPPLVASKLSSLNSSQNPSQAELQNFRKGESPKF